MNQTGSIPLHSTLLLGFASSHLFSYLPGATQKPKQRCCEGYQPFFYFLTPLCQPAGHTSLLPVSQHPITKCICLKALTMMGKAIYHWVETKSNFSVTQLITSKLNSPLCLPLFSISVHLIRRKVESWIDNHDYCYRERTEKEQEVTGLGRRKENRTIVRRVMMRYKVKR